MKTICLSRTDSIGDVILTLPLAGLLKEYYPDCKVLFIGKTYTVPVVRSNKFIDDVINLDEYSNADALSDKLNTLNIDAIVHVFPNKLVAKAAKKARIKRRIGTSHRFFHWWTCNERVNFTRKNSELHESQLNAKLLEPIIGKTSHTTDELASFFGFENFIANTPKLNEIDLEGKFNLVIHPKSQGSAVEWGGDNFVKLVELLPDDRCRIFLTGTKKEGEMVKEQIIEPLKDKLIDLTGKLTLEELIAFINQVDGLVAASTGPLHIAAACNKHALGLFSQKRPIHPGRWKPIGEKAEFIINPHSQTDDPFEEIRGITPESVCQKIVSWIS